MRGDVLPVFYGGEEGKEVLFELEADELFTAGVTEGFRPAWVGCDGDQFGWGGNGRGAPYLRPMCR